MLRALQIVLTVLTLTSIFTVQALACTTFCLKNGNEVLFGKNYDWMIGDGIVFVNRRGVAKMSADDTEKNVAAWISKYGSVTFNQYGWESPSGGMNEAGLVMELMWLDDTQWPSKNDLPTVDVLEFIQFNLDTAATADEVIRNSEKVRISSQVKLHYLVNDKQGNAATIEFLDGKLVAHSGKDLPHAALANDTYSRSINYSRRTAEPTSESSLDRFSRAARKSTEFSTGSRSEKGAVDYAFGVLDDVAQRNSTQWSIVYDQKRGNIHFKTRTSPQVKIIDAKAFDYACSAPVKMLDIDRKASGDATSAFTNYAPTANRDLIERAFKGTPFLTNVPASVKDHYASFPERFGCGTIKPVEKPKEMKASGSFVLVTPYPIVDPLLSIYRWITTA